MGMRVIKMCLCIFFVFHVALVYRTLIFYAVKSVFIVIFLFLSLENWPIFLFFLSRDLINIHFCSNFFLKE